MAGKCRVAYCLQLIEWSALCSSSSYFTGDVASAMFCSRLIEIPSPTLAFIGSDALYKCRILCKNSPWRGWCCVVFASTRHDPRPSPIPPCRLPEWLLHREPLKQRSVSNDRVGRNNPMYINTTKSSETTLSTHLPSHWRKTYLPVLSPISLGMSLCMCASVASGCSVYMAI